MSKNQITLGLLVILIAMVIFMLFSGQKQTKLGFSADGGYPTTFTNLGLTGTLEVNGAATLSGGTTLSGTNAFTGATGITTLTRSGSNRASSTSASAVTLASSDILNYNHITFTPNGAAMTMTLPASSALATLIPNTGDMIQKTINNATTTAGRTITIAVGAGETLHRASTTAKIDAGGSAILTFIRKASKNISVLLQN